MTNNQYLQWVLARYAVNNSYPNLVLSSLNPLLTEWGGIHLLGKEFSGSLAKGTGVSNGTDVDIFVSISSVTPCTLADMYGTLFNKLSAAGYNPRKQNVSIGIKISGIDVDLVPGKRQDQYGNDHNLYLNKSASRIQTNIHKHIQHVKTSGRLDEIKLVKIWRNLHAVPLPSFFLEMAVIDALRYCSIGDLSNNFQKALIHLRDNIKTCRYVDPANSGNIISSDCTIVEKNVIAMQAKESLLKNNWREIVW